MRENVYRPLLPKPPSPRSVSDRSPTSTKPGLFYPLHHQLGDALTHAHNERLRAGVVQTHAHLSPIARVDQSRRVDHHDAVLEGQPRPRLDEATVSQQGLAMARPVPTSRLSPAGMTNGLHREQIGPRVPRVRPHRKHEHPGCSSLTSISTGPAHSRSERSMRSTASAMRSSGVVSDSRTKPSPAGP